MIRFFKLLLLPIIGALLIIGPTIVRQYMFYGDLNFSESDYVAPDIPEFNPDHLNTTALGYEPFVDTPTEGDGRVIFDLTHNNNLELNDLGTLKSRIENRGATVVMVEDGDSLADELRGSTSVVVLAPTTPYSEEELTALHDFVEDGGRLLLAADPTRPVPPDEEEGLSLRDIFFPVSSIPAINSIANAFEITYFDDYLYNLVDNASSYRNVKFTNFEDNHALTQGLDTIVFFASYSLRGDGLAVVKGDENTTSPIRSGETDLPAAMLTTDERVLALGDLTVLTPPYHTVANNDAFMSRIADWLAVDERERDLEDFPYLFESPTVSLVQIDQEFLDPRVVAQVNRLQDSFQQADLTLTLSSAAAATDNDKLYIGTFEQTELITDYLVQAGISITVEMTTTDTPTETDETEAVDRDEEETVDETDADLETDSTVEAALEEATLKALEQITSEQSITLDSSNILTDSDELLTETLTLDFEEDFSESEESMDKSEDGPTVLLNIARFGTLGATGTSLFLLEQDEAGNQVVITLAEDYDMAVAALDRLLSGDFSNCAHNGNLTLCSTGEAQEDLGAEEEEIKDDTSSLATVFIMADDDGSEGSRTAASEWQTILDDLYDVTVWSNAADGIPDADTVAGYDLYIIDSGDYAAAPEDIQTILAFTEVDDSASVMFIGAQPLPVPADSSTFEPLNDLELTDADHPIAAGLTAEEIIVLEASESGVDPVVIPDPDKLYADSSIVFSRGPDSPEAGSPVVIASSDDTTGSRVILATFAFYRLPTELQERFALNATSWLLDE